MGKDSRQRHGGHLDSYFKTKLIFPSLSAKDQESCYSLGENGGSSPLLTLLSFIVFVGKRSRRKWAQFLQHSPHQTSIGLEKPLGHLGSFFRIRWSKPGRRAKRKGCLGERGGTLESSGSGSKLSRCGQVTLPGTGARQPP